MQLSKAKKFVISLFLALAMLVSASAADVASLIPIGHTVGTVSYTHLLFLFFMVRSSLLFGLFMIKLLLFC